VSRLILFLVLGRARAAARAGRQEQGFSSQQVRRMLAHGLTEEDDDQPAG